MTFNELYQEVKKKFVQHPEIMLERQKLAVQITDVFDNAFYILWENNQCLIEPFHYHDYDVCVVASQHDLELLFTERQYLFLARKAINIKGSFTDVMDFQELLSYVTRDNSYIVHEEIISKMLIKQDALSKDLGIIMQSLQLLLTNSLISLPEKYESDIKKTEPEKLPPVEPAAKKSSRKPRVSTAEKNEPEKLPPTEPAAKKRDRNPKKVSTAEKSVTKKTRKSK